MIIFDNVSKAYPRPGGGKKIILENFTATFPPGINIGILGRNGAGKSTLMSMISGSEMPDSGRILRDGKISWPLGFNGGVHGKLTGAQNTRFIADIYGKPRNKVLDFVTEFSELGPYLDMPVRTYSAGMRARLAFGICMAIEFEYYLIDEVIAVGDSIFKKKCKEVFEQRRENASLLLVSHSAGLLRSFCDIGGVMNNGKLTFFNDIEEAIQVHEEILRSSSAAQRRSA
ncbi:ABC transporter ATP-binding protein [Shinella curvata]|uniref:ABC transporter ATP-binding protein n=1 Tax=Shinella curvata TaxID=1817964 RepID=A0ABT8XDF3_9HYPH|nr:ABC transporter ATP-binding protein [Shinella curvata]MCJ8055250.1 ABC transporter ATP-binding protein [Shinella curvata]MDO6121667.1 ABC transporter ATP-binding protein [Shinella curvata]